MSDHMNYHSNYFYDFDDPSESHKPEDNEIIIKEKCGDELLVELYKERPFLYDKNNMNFKDALMKENAWQEISCIMKESNHDNIYTPMYCKKRITALRDSYNKEKKKAETQTKSGSGASQSHNNQQILKQFSFLENFIKRRKSYSNLMKSTSNLENVSGNARFTTDEPIILDKEPNNKNDKMEISLAKEFNTENDIPKMKRRKIDETRRLEDSLIQIGQRISTYLDKKVTTSDDSFLNFLGVEFEKIPEKDKNIRRKMLLDALIVPLTSEKNNKL